MAGDSITIEEIKALVNDYNVILAKYVAANKSLSSLGSYEMLSTKKLQVGILHIQVRFLLWRHARLNAAI